MNREPLGRCYAQTKWAKTEIDKLQADIQKFVAGNPYEIVSNVDVEAGEEVHRIRINQCLPPELEIMIGNILANLRDPLDNILAILSDEFRGVATGVSFPFSHDMNAYDTEIAKIIKLLPAGCEQLIRDARTYPGGNIHLRALHFLNRDKKHRVPIAPFNIRSSLVAGLIAIFKPGKLVRLGFKHGKHLFPSGPHNDLTQPDASKMPDFIPYQGFVFEPDIAAGDDEMELMTVKPGTQFYAQFKPTIDVAFTETPGLEREPVGIALHEMRQLVDGTLLTFENRFFT